MDKLLCAPRLSAYSPTRDICKHIQLKVIGNQGVTTVFQDVISKDTTGREQFHNLLNILKQNDIVVITKCCG